MKTVAQQFKESLKKERNVLSKEYGLLVDSVSIEDVADAFRVDVYDFYADYNIPGTEYDVETHPMEPNYIFVSFGHLRGKLPQEPTEQTRPIRKWFATFLPGAKLTWGVIKTER